MNAVISFVIVLAIIVVSMVLHELAHGYVALMLGDTTAKESGRLSLNPLKHLDPWMSVGLPVIMHMLGGPIFGGAKPVPVDFRRLRGGVWGMALVAIAGPTMNFLLAFAGFLVGHLTGALYNGDLLAASLIQFVLTNLGFCVFNLLPIPPLDGSRVLYALAPDGVRTVMERLETTAGVYLVFGIILIASSVISRFISLAVYGIFDWFLMIVGAA